MESIYFVDFFDTLIFRHILPSNVINKWCDKVCSRFHIETESNELYDLRMRIFGKIRAEKGEVRYRKGIEQLYGKLIENHLLDSGISEKDFYGYCYETELALESVVQYPNAALLRKLSKAKEKGASIYILSDTWFSSDDLKTFLKAQNVSISLFDGIFVSSEHGARKSTGDLYKVILDELDILPETVTMIGDNVLSDEKQAKRNRIHTQTQRHILLKALNYIKAKLGYDFSKHINRIFIRDCYRFRQPFSEYISIFYSFSERLHQKTKGEDIVFFAREGYYMKELYGNYLRRTDSDCAKEKLHYFLCSRRAITSVQIDKVLDLANILDLTVINFLRAFGCDDAETDRIRNRYSIDTEQLLTKDVLELLYEEIEVKVRNNLNAFLKYSEFVEKIAEPVNVVDVGWRGAMQLGLEELKSVKTRGYYIGLNGDLEREYNVTKVGLVFSEYNDDPYYYLLKSNIQLYELLLAAPHGSAQTYVEKDGLIDVPLVWEDNEKALYTDIISKWQESTLPLFNGLCAWSNDEKLLFSDRSNAKVVSRSALFSNKERIGFLHALDRGFIWNFGQETKGTKYNRKDVSIGLSIIWAPEKYMRFAAKVQRLLPAKVLYQALYNVVAAIYYVYTWLLVDIKCVIWGKQSEHSNSQRRDTQ